MTPTSATAPGAPPPSLLQSLTRLRKLMARARHTSQSSQLQNPDSLPARLFDVFRRTWDLGFTAFGGPAVHFQIIYARFVDGRGSGEKWIDEQTYQELFAVCQGLPGPASTKMLFCIALLRAGFVPALFVFFMWSLPGAIVMYALSLGVERIDEVLPSPVYALLSGLNASTVGIIALAAVQLADKAIKDDLTRVLVIFGGCAGLCYNALWYFPVLMVAGGMATVTWDGVVKPKLTRWRIARRQRSQPEGMAETMAESDSIPMTNAEARGSTGVVQRRVDSLMTREANGAQRSVNTTGSVGSVQERNTAQDHALRIRVGAPLAVAFFVSFAIVLIVRGLLRPLPLAFALFSNMYLAGTIIFGGGPVVIPLLRSYVVDPGWVSSRDFLIGLAIVQALPGPNFNFAVYLGALALQRSGTSTIFGAILGFIGIFTPGITLAVAVQSFWRVLRRKWWVVDVLRGVNATAVGLVFTAVYRLWEIGYLTPERSNGQSLGREPWWVVVAAVTYSASAWFKVPPAIAIVFGAVLGLCWYGAVGQP